MTTNEQNTHKANEKNTEKPSRPLETFRCGAIAASIWRCQSSTGSEYLDFSLSRSWKTKDGLKEGYSQSYFERNEEALITVIQEAAEFIRGYPLESKPDLVDDNPSIHGAASEAA